jgi:glycosyltransferase involved in cell wall biosynthesis
MKIWILSSNRWNSAITEYALSMCLALRKLGHEVIFSPLLNSPGEVRARKMGLKTEAFSTFHLTPTNIFILHSIYNSFRPTHIITCGGKDQALSLFIAHPRKFRFRGERIRSFSGVRNIIHNLSHATIKSFISPCLVITSELSKISSKPILEIPIGLDETLWNRKARTLERPECLIFGRFDPVKGHREFLPLWKLILQSYGRQFPNKHLPLLKIAGKKENLSKEDLVACAEKHGLSQDVQVLDGHVEDPATLLSSASVGVIPSLGSEVICRVAEEFLLCGTPILVSDAGALKETLFPGAGQFFSFDNINIDKVADFIDQSICEDLNVKLARRLQATQMFSLSTMGERLQNGLG